MRYYSSSKCKEEIRRKLADLYSEPSSPSRKVIDFDKDYDFFSDNEANMIKYSSKWFNPGKYDRQALQDKLRTGQQQDFVTNKMLKVSNDNTGGRTSFQRNEPSWRLERLGSPASQLTRDLEKLGRTPYHIGIEGEKFRVVAATLQKCNSPFVRRTFQFTSNGIIETPEARTDNEHMKIIPVINQGKKGVTQKLVTIRRFRVIKKDDLAGERSDVQQKVQITKGEKPRFLTVRIRPKDRQDHSQNIIQKQESDRNAEVIRLTSSTEEEEEEDLERTGNTASPSPQAEETDDGEEQITKPAVEDIETGTCSGQENIPKNSQKLPSKEDGDSNDTDDASIDNERQFGKRFSNYQNCFAQVRNQERQTCQVCSKRFPSSKQLREHVRVHHHHHRYTRSGGVTEDRIKTATSKFGRTRRVLNIAGLRSKYKML